MMIDFVNTCSEYYGEYTSQLKSGILEFNKKKRSSDFCFANRFLKFYKIHNAMHLGCVAITLMLDRKGDVCSKYTKCRCVHADINHLFLTCDTM